MSHFIRLLAATLVALPMSLAAPAVAESGERTLFDFRKPDAERSWQTVTDRVKGGASEGQIKITDEGTMEFSGRLSLENNGGFASVRSRPGKLGLALGDTLLIRVKGDGKVYTLNLYSPSLPIGSAYRTPIPTSPGEWTEMRLPVRDFSAGAPGRGLPEAGPIDAAKLHSIGFLIAGRKPGPFHLEIGSIKVLSGSAAANTPPTRKTFTFKTFPGGTLEMVVHFPTGWKESDRRPAIVFFFGGGWENGNIQAFERQADHLAQRGMVAARADYRVKSRQGVKPDKCVEDAKSAVRWIRANAAKLGIDPDRIAASGGSAGGHIAACTAVTEGLEAPDENRSVSSKANALVLFNPVLRFQGNPQMMKRLDNEEALGNALSPTLHVTKDTPPTLLLYGTEDFLLGQGEEFMKRAKDVGFRVEMFTAAGQGHGFFHRPPWYQKTVARMDEFLTSLGYLKPESETVPKKP